MPKTNSLSWPADFFFSLSLVFVGFRGVLATYQTETSLANHMYQLLLQMGQCPADFSSNTLAWKFLVRLMTLISWFRYV